LAPLGLGLCSQFRKLSAWLLFDDDDDDGDGDSSFFRNVGISVPGCTASYSKRPTVYICSCKNLKSVAFLKSKYKEKREGQVGHYFICKGIWAVVIINVWHFEVGSF